MSQTVLLQQVFVKALTFKMLQWPLQPEQLPSMKMKLSCHYMSLKDDYTEVVLTVTLNGTVDDEPVYQLVLEQAGVFHCHTTHQADKQHLASTQCPEQLIPFAQQVIYQTLLQFLPLGLPSINFIDIAKVSVRQTALRLPGHE